ncbi:MAG: PucR family transcriptional regulator, partial [Streptosporangiaceae bacterium]
MAPDSNPWTELPKDLAERIRPHLPAVADEMIVEIQRRVREYSRAGAGPYSETLRLVVERSLQHFVDRIGSPEHSDAVVTDFFHAIGRGEAGEGRTLDPLQTAMRVGGLVAWRRLSARTVALDPQV